MELRKRQGGNEKGGKQGIVLGALNGEFMAEICAHADAKMVIKWLEILSERLEEKMKVKNTKVASLESLKDYEENHSLSKIHSHK